MILKLSPLLYSVFFLLPLMNQAAKSRKILVEEIQLVWKKLRKAIQIS